MVKSKNSCSNLLRQIEGAKNQWVLAAQDDEGRPTWNDLLAVYVCIREVRAQPKFQPGMSTEEVLAMIKGEKRFVLPRKTWGSQGEQPHQFQVIDCYYIRSGHDFLTRVRTLDFTNAMLQSISSEWFWQWEF